MAGSIILYMADLLGALMSLIGKVQEQGSEMIGVRINWKIWLLNELLSYPGKLQRGKNMGLRLEKVRSGLETLSKWLRIDIGKPTKTILLPMLPY